MLKTAEPDGGKGIPRILVRHRNRNSSIKLMSPLQKVPLFMCVIKEKINPKTVTNADRNTDRKLERASI